MRLRLARRGARAEHLQPAGRCVRRGGVDAARAGRAEFGARSARRTEETGLEAWPPAGGQPIDLTGLYATLQARGYGYGPSFQGLREAWRVGDAVYGRAVLPEALSSSAEEYGLHPALLDAALHVLRLAQVDGVSDGLVLLPFEWSEVTLLRSARGSCACVCRWSAVARAKPWRSCSWPMATGGGGAGWRAAAEGSERSADPGGGAQRGAASVPPGVASGGVERGRG